MKLRIIVILFVLIFQFVGQETFAKQATAGDDAQNQASEQKSVDDKAMKIFLDKIEIYGRIAKPQTVFIIPGTDPRVNGIRIEKSKEIMIIYCGKDGMIIEHLINQIKLRRFLNWII